MSAKVLTQLAIKPETMGRILREGYGPGAWHGPDMAAAMADVTPEIAYQRPASGRHNIAEVALHHAWVVRNVLGQVTRRTPTPFPMAGEDWFTLDSAQDLAWSDIVDLVSAYHAELEAAATAGELASADNDPLDIVLGVTGHAIYHAGQIQLVKVLLAKQQ